ncbi:hypothetical protein KASHIRA_01980 [Serratia phage vB_SmaM-Kashira]|nr:hypothetical protein KASHIRA_01980 [Serratia phage vB_SmaM-Kashira]
MNLSKLFYFDELTPAAQEQARVNVMIPELEAKSKNIYKARAQYMESPNKAINDPHHIRRLINGSQAIYKARAMGDKYLLPYLRQNCTIFTECGAYVYYLGRVSVVAGGITTLICDPDQSRIATQAYIDVNERGPAYHDRLYRELAKK